MAKKKVLLVEDHPLTREGLKMLLEQVSEVEVVGEVDRGDEALRVAQESKADVVVMDIGLPGIDGIEATKQIKAALKDVKVVMLTAHDNEQEILAALSAGADGYCVKSGDPGHLLTAVKAVADGAAYLDPKVANLVLRRVVPTVASSPTLTPEPASCLSDREKDVLRLIADGLANHEISGKLHLSVGTIKGYVREILNKLCVNDRTQAAVVALRKGLI